MLGVEVVGVVAVAAMVWALWKAPQTKPARFAPADQPVDVDVLVRCSGQDIESVRATLLAVRGMGALHVLDLGARPEVASLALDEEAVYIATDAEDLDGLGQALHALAAPSLLLLEAGDVPHPDIVAMLHPWLDDGDVAIVQGAAVSAQRDSAEHDAGGRHDKEFERRALLPSLGARGVAAFVGSGALIRRSALIGLPIGHATRPMVQAEITASLLAEGWRIVAPGGEPVVAVAPYTQPDVVESMHACEASGALHLLQGPNGALRPGRQSVRQRIAQLALAVRPLAGIRRSLLIVVLLGSLLSGELPFQPTSAGLLGLWMPWFVLSAVGLWLLSEGSLRPGDRLRASMRLLGASWRGLLAPNGRPEDPQYAVAGAFGVHHGVASAMAVAAISVVVGLRGVSDRVSHTLAPLPVDHTAGLLVVALWSLGGGLDALRLLARRAQTRRATRVASSLPSTIADRAALVVDLTPHGAAVISDVESADGCRVDARSGGPHRQRMRDRVGARHGAQRACRLQRRAPLRRRVRCHPALRRRSARRVLRRAACPRGTRWHVGRPRPGRRAPDRGARRPCAAASPHRSARRGAGGRGRCDGQLGAGVGAGRRRSVARASMAASP